jgi:hypothetical protein
MYEIQVAVRNMVIYGIYLGQVEICSVTGVFNLKALTDR